MFMQWGTGNDYLLVCSLPQTPNNFHVVTTGNRRGHVVMGNLVDLIDNLIEEWYPGKTMNKKDTWYQIL